MEGWSTSKSSELFGVQNWGEGYFDINAKGHICVRPSKNGHELDLYDFVTSMIQRGIEVPLLIRFDGIIRHRVRRLCDAFKSAMQELGYQGGFKGVFPIKVNQQRHVVDIVRHAGRDSFLGLEVGSKPELVAVLAIHDTPGALLLCNGYKDREYIELALLGQKLGRRVIIIVEQLSEVPQILAEAARLGIDPEIGLRMKPSSKGAGKWEASAGDKAKFGLSPHEIVTAIEELKNAGKLSWLKLLHFHIGSQITSIAAIKRVLKEATRMYTEIHKLAPSLCIFDAGGGLAVDYDGSRTNFESSMNYTLEEYARDVIDAIGSACKEASIPHPDIVTESGRAIVAHHAVLVTETIDTAPALDARITLGHPPSNHPVLKTLASMYEELNIKNCHEYLNDAISIRDEVLERFNTGDLSLVERAFADRVFWHIIAKVRQLSSSLKYVPEDIERLDEVLRDTYFCNFSVFQSMPDSWAINQLFPIMPIHRLDEEPTRSAVIADVSCDSDGKIEKFIDLKDVKNYVKFHSQKTGQPYFIASFLVGAYQEILGDLHNLFGDTNAVHVDFDEHGDVKISHVVEGDTVREVLNYVQYDPQDLLERLRSSIERALREGRLSPEESAKFQKRYKEALEGYTYLQVE